MHSSDTALIHFDNVRVPHDNIIGEEGNNVCLLWPESIMDVSFWKKVV